MEKGSTSGVVRGNRYYWTKCNNKRVQGTGNKKWVLFSMVVGASVVTSARQRTFHKRIQCIQSEYYFSRRSSGACPAFALLGDRRYLLHRHPREQRKAWDSLAAFLSCASRVVHWSTRPPEPWAAKTRRIRRTERGKGTASRRTLGGLPLFLFSPATGEASGADPDAPAAFFLFLLPLGRPRPRFTGDGGAPKSASQRTEWDWTRLIDRCRGMQRKGGLTRI
jgi:hypothetical protein